MFRAQNSAAGSGSPVSPSATAVIVCSNSTPPAVTAAAAVLTLAASAVALWLPDADGQPVSDLPDHARAWFVTLARLEGLSLVVMVLVAMPVRKATGISLDSGAGALGWAHGVLLLLYPAVDAGRRARPSAGTGRDPAPRSSPRLLPFGTFAFRWRNALREPPPTPAPTRA